MAENNLFNSFDSPSSNPSTTKGAEIESILEIFRKEEAIRASQPSIEKFVEELFYHISKFSDETISNGKISQINESEINVGDYRIEPDELPFINNSIRILNRLFKISHGKIDPNLIESKNPKIDKIENNFIKIIDIDDLSPEEIIRINVAVGSKNLAHYLADIVNHENCSRKFLPQFSPEKATSSPLFIDPKQNFHGAVLTDKFSNPSTIGQKNGRNLGV